MAACQILGHPDTYGLGIRISIYVQWFGMIITCWLSESDALTFKFLNGLTILATSIGLALNLQVLQPAEIYVVLLLLCGTLYFLIPIYLWRLLTCCRPWWDPERWTKVKLGWLFRTAMALMFGILLGLQIWFWCTGVYMRPPGTDTDCQQYGFLLGQVPLDNPANIAINIILHIAMLTVGVWLFCKWTGMFDECRSSCRRGKGKWRITQSRIESLQQLHTISDFLVAAIVTTAIELVITWNNIGSVNDLDTAAQLIPPIISAAYFLRSIYVCMSDPAPEEDCHADCLYWDSGSAFYTPPDDNVNGVPIQSYTVYGDYSHDWAGPSRHPYHHRRRHRRHRRSRHVSFDLGQPEMSTAYSCHATVVDAPDDGPAAAENIVQPEPVHENA